MNSLSLHKRCRRGSLPFKKRPFRLVQQQQASVVVVCGKGRRHSGNGSAAAADLDRPRKKHASPYTMSNDNPAEQQPPLVHTVTDSKRMKEDDPFAALNLMAIAASTAAASSAVSLLSTASTDSSAASPSSPPPSSSSLGLPARNNSSATRLVTLSTRFSALASPGGGSGHHDEDVMFPRVVHVSDGQENANNQSRHHGSVDSGPAAVSLSMTPSLLSPASKKRIIQRAVQQEHLQSMLELQPLPTQNTDTSPLTSPLPGGCHGRTSRTHFYCRRRPCYKGSNYCKLHYQHFVLSGSITGSCDDASHDGGEAAAAVAGILCRETSLGTCSNSSHADLTNDEAGTEQQQQQQQQQHPMQNRRYTGRSCEQRCLATTTRGRPCAYVAASGHSKYCNLHADYDISPSPRRGGGTLSSSANASAASSETHVQGNIAANNSMNKRPSPGGSTTNSKTGGRSLPSLAFRPSSSLVSVASSSSDSNPSSSTVSQPKSGGKRDRDSDMSTTTAVVSATTGHKKRCTNAKLAKKHADSPFPLLSMFSTDQWMHKKVSISTGPLTGCVGVVEKWSNGWVSVRVPGVGLHNRRSFELYLVQEEQSDGEDAADAVLDADEQKRALLRTVSREAASPSPVAMTKSISTSSSNNKKMVATKSKCLIASSSPTEIPQSPCPTRHVADVLRTPVSQHVVTNLVPKVTPCLPKMPQKDVPLVQSLLLAQEGNGRMDLLFGTAALERSRRTVRKPTLYQDTEMLDKKQGGGGRSNSDAYHHIPFKKRTTGPSSPTADVTGKVDE